RADRPRLARAADPRRLRRPQGTDLRPRGDQSQLPGDRRRVEGADPRPPGGAGTAGVTTGVWTRKDLLGIAELSVEEIELLLDTAESFAEVAARPVKKVPTLRGKSVVNLFFEPSTRTRVSFEIAAQRL